MRNTRKFLWKGSLGGFYFTVGIVLGFGWSPARASETAQAVFKAVAPSVMVVKARTKNGDVQGSAVANEKLCARRQSGDGSSHCQEYRHTRFSTNAHVVGDATAVRLEWDRRQVTGQIIFRDSEIDLAIIEVAGDAGLPVQPVLGDRRTLVEVGETVFAVGAPLGLQRSLSEGIVSGLRVVNGTLTIQVTAAISPGSSGGGLFDARGNFIGVPTFKNVRGEALNFAVDGSLISGINLAIRVRELIARDMLSLNISFPAAYGGDRFIRFLSEITTLPNGEPAAHYITYFDVFKRASERNDWTILSDWVLQIKNQFEAKTQSGLTSSSKDDAAVQSVRLLCTYVQTQYDQTVHHKIYAVDFQRQTVNGLPAEISDQRVTLKTVIEGQEFTILIDRRTGGFLVNTRQISPLFKGVCEKAGEKAF